MDESNLDELLYQISGKKLNYSFLNDIKCVLVLNDCKQEIGAYSLFNNKLHIFFKLVQEYILQLNFHPEQLRLSFKEEPVVILEVENSQEDIFKLKPCFVKLVRLTNADILRYKSDLKQKKIKKPVIRKYKYAFHFKPIIKNNIAKKQTTIL